ncbi:DUF4224 domain-containing protein [Pseudomonas sp. 210_17 TE3656]
MEIQSETLVEDEIAAITGYQIPSKQISWLERMSWLRPGHWIYHAWGNRCAAGRHRTRTCRHGCCGGPER